MRDRSENVRRHPAATRTVMLLATGFWLLLLLPYPCAQADSLVVSAQGVDLKPGASIPETQPVKVPAGGSLQLILQSGATITIQGPYEGPVSGYAKSRGVSTGLENSPTRSMPATRGGTR